MPFKSKAQARMMWATDPTMAQEMAASTPADKTPKKMMKGLPQYVSKKKKAKGKKGLPEFRGKK